MKYIQAFYILFAIVYGLIFAFLAAMQLSAGDEWQALVNLGYGALGACFGLLVNRLLSRMQTRKKVKR